MGTHRATRVSRRARLGSGNKTKLSPTHITIGGEEHGMRRTRTLHRHLALTVLFCAATACERDRIHVPIRFPLGSGPIAKLKRVEQAEQ